MAIWESNSKQRGIRYKPMVRTLDGEWMKSHTWHKKLDAKKEERELLVERDKGVYGRHNFKPIPFPQATDAWLSDIENRGGSIGYLVGLKQHVNNHILRFFGTTDIKQIRPSQISAFMKCLQDKGIAPVTVNSVIKSLRAMFLFHIEEDNISYNPVKRKFRVSRIEREPTVVWTRQEAERFLSYTDNKYKTHKRWVFLIYKIAANCGLRFGEIIALERSDFDFENKRIRISKAFSTAAMAIKTPKNGKARYTTLSPALATEIQKYIVDNQKFAHLFKDEEGNYYSYNTFRWMHYVKDVIESGVRKTKFHNLRRFFNRQYLENGGTEVHLRKIMGHAGREMTDLYFSQQENMTELAKIVNI